MGIATRYYLITLLFGPVIGVALYAALHSLGGPLAPAVPIFVGTAGPLCSLMIALSWPGWAQDMARLNELPPKVARSVLFDCGELSWSTRLLVGGYMAAAISTLLMEVRGFPLIVSVAAPMGVVLILAFACGPSIARSQYRALRRVAQIPVCGRCGYALRSLDQSCSECGWAVDAVEPSSSIAWSKYALAALAALVGALLPVIVHVALPWSASEAEAAALRRVLEVTSMAESDVEKHGVRAGPPDARGRRIVTGWLHAPEERPSFRRWTVLVGDHMQPLAWEIGPDIAHRPEMLTAP